MTTRRLLALATLIAFLAMGLPAAGHLGFGLCLWRGDRYPPSAEIPVVYGFPSAEGTALAGRGRIALGGCQAGPVASLCPHCRWPARLRGGLVGGGR